MMVGALLGKITGQSYAEETPQKGSDISAVDKDWEQLPLDILSGACLVSDPEAPMFGATISGADCVLSQYIHVYQGLEIMLSNAEENNWVGYDRQLRPVAILRNNEKKAAGKKALITVPAGVSFLRGSGSTGTGQPQAWVKNFALYALNCGLSKPDVSSCFEVTELDFNQFSRRDEDGNFDKDTQDRPSLGDVFFSPIGTDIILTFNNANVVPYIFEGDNFESLSRRKIFTPHLGFGCAWYHCKTTDICNYLGASYETFNNCAKTLTLDELRAADPHLYIRFPGSITNSLSAAVVRAKDVEKRYQRLFTVVHLTDTHGDADSTYAAYKYADQIGADFVALTGDYVPYDPYHGFGILNSIINQARTPTVFSLGNHDVVGITDKTVYSTNIAPIRETLWASEEHIYYYRDFRYGGETIRAISLFPFYDKAKSRTRGYYTESQLSWLCDALAAAPDNAHIFILRHFAHHRPILLSEDENLFYDYANSNTDGNNLWLGMDADPVADIVDAYNKRAPIFARYTGELKDGSETVTVEYDFSNRPNSEFVAYFVGHVHLDAVGYARNTQTKQVVLCSLCTTGVKGSAEYSSYTTLSTPRDYGTDSQIALNVFTFNFKKKSIYVARVGNGIFNDREKTWMELPYGI